MDISSITSVTNEIQITHPVTAEPIGLTIRLLALSSPQVRAVERKFTNENLRSRGKVLTAEKLDANRMDVLVAATEGWEWAGDLTWHGEKPEATPAAIRKVYSEAPWIRSQVDAALSDEAAFFRTAQ